MIDLSWKILKSIEDHFGPAFYLLDIERFRDNLKRFQKAFNDIYQNSQVAYSYKTNYIPLLCQIVDHEGAYAEVVSRFEYECAIRLGISPNRIIFNGPVKSLEDYATALPTGCRMHIDSLYEIDLAEKIMSEYCQKTFKMGLRVNLDCLSVNTPTRFGLDPGNGDLETAFQRLSRIPNCQVVGLHCHSSAVRSVQSYKKRVDFMLDITSRFFTQEPPEYVDLGGGFFGPMPEEMRKQFSEPVPSYEDYAQCIAGAFITQWPNPPCPELILEPGVAVVGDVMQFVTKIIGVKRLQNRRVAITAGSIHTIRPTRSKIPSFFDVFEDPNSSSRMEGPISITGYTCMEHDILYERYPHPLGPGDFLAFKNVGAYTIVMKPPFISPCPPVVFFNSASGKIQVAKSAEQTTDVLCTYPDTITEVIPEPNVSDKSRSNKR